MPLRVRAVESVLRSVDVPRHVLPTYMVLMAHADLHTGRVRGLSLAAIARGGRDVDQPARYHVRTAQRHLEALRQTCAVTRHLRYRVGARTLQERNRASDFDLQEIWPTMPPPEDALALLHDLPITDEEIAAYARFSGLRVEPELHGPGPVAPAIAQDASAGVAPPPFRKRHVEAAAPVVAASVSCPVVVPAAGVTKAVVAARAHVNDALGPEVVTVLDAVRSWPQLATIATEASAARLWMAAEACGRDLPTAVHTVRDVALKSAGREGPRLESMFVDFIKGARPVTPPPADLTREQRRAQRERDEAVQRKLEEDGERERQRKMRAAAGTLGLASLPVPALTRGPPRRTSSN